MKEANPTVPMSLIEEIDKSRFAILLLEEEKYLDKIAEITKSMKGSEKICYVCLSKPYADIYNELKKKGVDVKRFYFIDVLSSHYGKKKELENCTYLTSPTNLLEIKFAVSGAFREKKCTAVIFDTISTMLIYQETSNIVRFTHDFLSEKEQGKVLYLVIKHEAIPAEESEKLVRDLEMLADRTINVK